MLDGTCWRVGATVRVFASRGPVRKRLPDRTRAQILRLEAAAHPADFEVSLQSMSNHTARLRGSGLVVAMPEGWGTRAALADTRVRYRLADLHDVVLVVTSKACGSVATQQATGAPVTQLGAGSSTARAPERVSN